MGSLFCQKGRVRWCKGILENTNHDILINCPIAR